MMSCFHAHHWMITNDEHGSRSHASSTCDWIHTWFINMYVCFLVPYCYSPHRHLLPLYVCVVLLFLLFTKCLTNYGNYLLIGVDGISTKHNTNKTTFEHHRLYFFHRTYSYSFFPQNEYHTSFLLNSPKFHLKRINSWIYTFRKS